MTTPKTTHFKKSDTHRLIPSKVGDSVLSRISDSDEHFGNILDIEYATNSRLIAEDGRNLSITAQELVDKVPCHNIINGSFTHHNPEGNRFNASDRGAWYASTTLVTAQKEVIFHKTQELLEIDYLHASVTYDDFYADFNAEFHDIRNGNQYKKHLTPDKTSYSESQRFAVELLDIGSQGIIYPSVRKPGGTCIVCFRPPQVINVRRVSRYRFVWNGDQSPTISHESDY